MFLDTTASRTGGGLYQEPLVSTNLRPSSSSSMPCSIAVSAPACWQADFLKLLPAIERDVRIAFRKLKGDHRDEAVQEVICHCCQAYARLNRQGRPGAATARSLARYAVAQYWVGRRIGSPLNVQDVTSAYCRYKKGVRVESLHHRDHAGDAWQEMLVEDRHVTPADLAASRIDYPAWLSTLGTYRRRIAEILATGEKTKRVARMFRISPARISQLRRELMDAWEAFHVPKPTVTAEL